MVDTLSAVINWLNRAGALHWDFASAMFVQVAALVAVLGLVELCLRRRVRPVVRYWLWALVVLKLMLPVTLSTPASVAYWVVQEPAPVASTSIAPTVEIAPTTAAAPAEPPIATDINQPPSEVLRGSPQVAINPPIESPSPPRLATLESPGQTTSVTTQKRLPSLTASGWLLLAWCSGCVLIAVIVLRRTAKVQQLVRRATEAPGQLAAPMQVACELLDLSARRVRLRISDEVGCPAICGLWRPTILIPRRLVGQLDDEQFELVFVHELSHWKRWDLQMNLLQTVLQIVYFYNPAVWFANAVLRRLREEAVDDAVLITAGAPQDRYSNTLLDVAAHSLGPVEMSVRLIGILESRKALASRIYRLATVPLPKSARLGLWGFAAVALVALALLPMAGSPRAIADKQPASPADKASADTTPEKKEQTVPTVALSGRIVDEDGKPVTDAIVQIVNVSNGPVQETATRRDGRYIFDRPWIPGEHHVLIYSDRCLGFTDSHNCPHVLLDSSEPIVRDFTLKLACQVRVQTLDEEGHPISKVRLFKAGPNNPYQADTDRQGWITIGGLVPAEYVFAFKNNGFVIERLTVKIESPKTVVERKLVLKRGVAIKATVLCWDGKPAAGWRVVALPSWWSFSPLSFGERIQEDGTIVLPHIGPGAYDLTISIPNKIGTSRDATLLSNVELIKEQKPLSLRVDAPSPGSMVMIEGQLRFIGGRPRQHIWVTSNSLDGRGDRRSTFVAPGSDTLQVGPIPRGRYSLLFTSPEIETKRIDAVIAPVGDLKVDIHVFAPIVLRGSISVAKGAAPIANLRIRVIKLKDVQGRALTPGGDWQWVDSQRKFAEQLPGPGVYAVEATADGLATVRSEPINTEHMPKNEIHLTLAKGASVAGTVVDEEGRPIDGAVVMSLAKAGGQLPMSFAQINGEMGVQTVGGRFRFEGLTLGKDTFRVVHPNFALATVRNFEVRPQGQEPLTIVMKRGATVSGHVQNERGTLLAGVSLRFRRNAGIVARDRYRGQFARAVTDANGYYEVHHLPEELVHISLDQGERSLGVFHQAVLPLNGTARTVDFGGNSKVSGQLFINGVPLASSRLLLTDEETYSDDFAATAMTNPEGAFFFAGVPPGKRYLYFSVRKPGATWDEWVRVRSLDINAAARNFGRIDHRTGTVTVKVTGRPKDDAMVSVYFYDPGLLFQVRGAGRPHFPRAKDAPFVFENVGPGRYDIAVSADNQPPRFRQMLVVSPDNLNPTVTVDWPHGTASIRGTIDRALRDMMRNRFIELRSPDRRWSAPLRFQEDGRFELGEIPAGTYSLIMMWDREGAFVPLVLKEIRLAEGETKTLDIKKEMVPQSELLKGVLNVTVLTPQGIPLPGCEFRVTGPNGALKPTRSHPAQAWFAAPPGTYQLSADYLGAVTVNTTVEIKPTFKDGVWSTRDQVLNLTLAPIE